MISGEMLHRINTRAWDRVEAVSIPELLNVINNCHLHLRVQIHQCHK